MSLLFTLGYIGIFVEEIIGLNKAGVALVMAVSLWTIYSDGAGGPVRQAGARITPAAVKLRSAPYVHAA